MKNKQVLERAARDGKPFGFTECPTCPEWVVRCAHFEERFLILGDSQILDDSEGISKRYAVGICYGDYFEDPKFGGLDVHMDSSVPCHYTDDRDSADHDFTRREQDLLSQGDALKEVAR